jgi:hypothetical protein
MSEQEWMQFLSDTYPDRHRICRIDSELADRIHALVTLVHIERSYVHKLLAKHGMETRHLPLIAVVIARGTAIVDRARHVTFLYDDFQVTGRPLKVTIKANRRGDAILVCTFHKLSYAELRRRLRKSAPIRP